MALIRRVFFLLLFVIGLGGCYSRVETFQFNVDDKFIPVFKRVSDGSVTYKLREPVVIDETNSSVFVFGYRSLSPFTLSILSSKRNELLSKRLTLGGEVGISLSIPVPSGKRIWGFRVNIPSLLVERAGISPDNRPTLFAFTDKGFSLGSCTEVVAPTRVDKKFFSSFKLRVNTCGKFRGNENRLSRFPGFMLVLRVDNSASKLELLSIELEKFKDKKITSKKGDFVHFSLKLPHREERFFLYPAVFKFPIAKGDRWEMRVVGDDKVRIYSLECNYWKSGALSAIPADPGTVLNYDPSFWRHRNFEIFSWNLFPKMLIMDTADYHIQSKFFKRLAFFLEKKGYVGKIVKEAVVANKHGYNAHDYRAEDLARFYNTAYTKKIKLNSYETLLKKILIRNGILSGSINGLVSPITGGVISISRSSGSYLRRLLLTHESFHGIFFSLPSYREVCFRFWNGLSSMDKDFWRFFFELEGV